MMWFPSIWYPSLAHRRIKAAVFLLCTLAMLCGCAEFAVTGYDILYALKLQFSDSWQFPEFRLPDSGAGMRHIAL